jgi:hypothetical protein
MRVMVANKKIHLSTSIKETHFSSHASLAIHVNDLTSSCQSLRRDFVHPARWEASLLSDSWNVGPLRENASLRIEFHSRNVVDICNFPLYDVFTLPFSPCPTYPLTFWSLYMFSTLCILVISVLYPVVLFVVVRAPGNRRNFLLANSNNRIISEQRIRLSGRRWFGQCSLRCTLAVANVTNSSNDLVV